MGIQAKTAHINLFKYGWFTWYNLIIVKFHLFFAFPTLFYI